MTVVVNETPTTDTAAATLLAAVDTALCPPGDGRAAPEPPAARARLEPLERLQPRLLAADRASLTSCATRAASSGLFTTSVWLMSTTRTSLAA